MTMPLQQQEPAVYNAGVGYPVDEVTDGNLTLVDVYGTGQYGRFSAASMASLPAHNQGLQPSSPPDLTGAKDTANINRQLQGAANLGVPGQLELGLGLFTVNADLVFGTGGLGLRGSGGSAASGDDAGKGLGTTIQIAPGTPASAFTTSIPGGQSVTAVLACLDQGPGVTGGATYGQRFSDFWIDATNALAGVDGIAFFGAIQGCVVQNVGVNKATGNGFAFYTDTSASFGSPFPDGFTLLNCMLQRCGGAGVSGKCNDLTAVAVHAQLCTGDGWVINGGNGFLTSCRADHCANGFTVESLPGGSGVFDATTLVNCGTEGNNLNGLNVINTSTSGNGVRNYVLCSGCKFGGDGVNGGAGGGGFAGIAVSGFNLVTLHGCHVTVRTHDAAAGCPQYAVATAAAGTGPGKPQAIIVDGGFLGYMTAVVNDAAGIGAALTISSKTLTGQGFEPATVTPYPEAVTGGSLALTGAYTAQGAAISVTNTASTNASPIGYTAAAAGDGVFEAQVTGDTSRRVLFDSNGTLQWGPGNAVLDCKLLRATANKLGIQTADLDIQTAGRGLRVSEGSNAKQGTAALTAGSVVVANTSVTANSRIFLTSQADGGTPGFLRVSARTAGTSFTITSSSGTDTSTVAFEIFEPG